MGKTLKDLTKEELEEIVIMGTLNELEKRGIIKDADNHYLGTDIFSNGSRADIYFDVNDEDNNDKFILDYKVEKHVEAEILKES